MRKLATIRRIDKLEPIENADKIELARVDGWQLVTAKDNGFKEGDLVVYVEIDSLLPSSNPNFEFMKPRGFKVKTAKLRGVTSQGIIFPLSILEYNNVDISSLSYGDDVTSIIGITKFEVDDDISEEAENKGKVKREKGEVFGRAGFPSFIKKTDENRYQNHIRELEDMISRGVRFEITEKLDGTSASYGMIKEKKRFLGIPYGTKYKFYICSRNLRISENDTGSKYVQISKSLEIKKYMKNIMKENKLDKIVLQGEIVGQGIQKDKYKIGQKLKFYLFNMVVDGCRYNIADIRKIKKDWLPTIESVPIISKSFQFDSIEEIATLSKMRSILNPNTIAEGIVFRTDGFSYKAINPEFLLKNNE